MFSITLKFACSSVSGCTCLPYSLAYLTLFLFCSVEVIHRGNNCFLVSPCTGVMEVCARQMWCSVMWYAGWCWAISTLVHTLLSPWRKKEKEHDRCSLGEGDSNHLDCETTEQYRTVSYVLTVI